MIRMLALLLPALIPSWRFFATVTTSQRTEFCLLGSVDEAPHHWRELRPRPVHVPLYAMLARLLWNPRWNETLFLVSCTQRFLDSGSETNLHEILMRIRSDLRRSGVGSDAVQYIQMRILVLRRSHDRIVREEICRSPVYSLNFQAAE